MAKTKPEPQTETQSMYRIVTNPDGKNLAEIIGLTIEEVGEIQERLRTLMKSGISVFDLIEKVNQLDSDDEKFHKVLITWMATKMCS